MRVCHSIQEYRGIRGSADWNGCSVGFVPTMGALHAGHVALLERARAENDRVILSIFVNPTQFNDPNDLAGYPRTLDADVELARPFTDVVWAPRAADLYPDEYRFRVTENILSTRGEGAHRPGHFDGVLTVVLKLFNVVQPHRAYFGEKDWQQLQLVKGMVEALLLPIEIVPCSTVRDAQGRALSSRNRRLSAAALEQLAVFPARLRDSKNPSDAIDALSTSGFDVDYVEDWDGVRVGAVRLEGIRLIDNVRL